MPEPKSGNPHRHPSLVVSEVCTVWVLFTWTVCCTSCSQCSV